MQSIVLILHLEHGPSPRALTWDISIPSDAAVEGIYLYFPTSANTWSSARRFVLMAIVYSKPGRGLKKYKCLNFLDRVLTLKLQTKKRPYYDE